eukprot:scaffold319_cov244-Pinguiococcus_pyrenoidosus.AAC.21
MGVGILRPNWLEGSVYIGQESVAGFVCDVWEAYADDTAARGAATRRQGRKALRRGEPFLTYWAEVKTTRPVRWRFFDDAQFDVVTFKVGERLEEESWAIPSYCATQDDKMTR